MALELGKWPKLAIEELAVIHLRKWVDMSVLIYRDIHLQKFAQWFPALFDAVFEISIRRSQPFDLGIVFSKYLLAVFRNIAAEIVRHRIHQTGQVLQVDKSYIWLHGTWDHTRAVAGSINISILMNKECCEGTICIHAGPCR